MRARVRHHNVHSGGHVVKSNITVTFVNGKYLKNMLVSRLTQPLYSVINYIISVIYS